jgi:hypothetical protein
VTSPIPAPVAHGAADLYPTTSNALSTGWNPAGPTDVLKSVRRITAPETPRFVMHFYTSNAAPSSGQCLDWSGDLVA